VGLVGFELADYDAEKGGVGAESLGML